jgi:cysteine desulfurase / selenocysteine lyase
MLTDKVHKNADSEFVNQAVIEQIASRLFNEFPEDGNLPENKGSKQLLRQNDKQDPLGYHADDLVDQQTYSGNKDGSYGLKHFINRSQPSKPGSSDVFDESSNTPLAPFFDGLGGGLPSDDIIDLTFLYENIQTSLKQDIDDPHVQLPLSGNKCLARQVYDQFTENHDGTNLEGLLQSFKKIMDSSDTKLDGSIPWSLKLPTDRLYADSQFDVATIRKDFPALNQKVNGKPLIWFDNAATTQKPRSVIDAVATFYANDNSNIHRGAHTLAARATDAYENAREKIRKFIGADSASEIIFVRGTTEGINLIAQTWGRKFIQPGDEILLTTLEHHANIVPWQMLAKEKGAIIRVAPVNDNGEIILEEYARLLGPRTKFVSLTQASNGLGTVLPVKEMVQMAKRYNARVLVDGAQSIAHIPANVQTIDADFFVFSGHKIFSPNGIGAIYARSELMEIMPPWHGGGNMIKNVTFEETTYNEPPAKFEAGTPNVADAIGLGVALDYVSAIGIENIARYEHFLTEYGMQQLSQISNLRLIGTAKDKVGILSFVLKNIPNEEVGKLLDREGIAVRAGHHCTQPALRRFGVESTVRPSLAFYNTKEEIDYLVYAIKKIQRH